MKKLKNIEKISGGCGSLDCVVACVMGAPGHYLGGPIIWIYPSNPPSVGTNIYTCA